MSDSEEEWKKKLSKEQYHVLREKGTEVPFTGKLLYNDKKGEYRCAACGKVVFDSDTKYKSSSGWPSFDSPHDRSAVTLSDDFSHGMHRIEVSCANCGSHLGHVFDDPSVKTGKYYCINSASLDFKDKE
jgi:peptide-methionine (R)-S-oxide reductase